VLVTVYEGHVIAETRSARTELAAGAQATLRPDATIVAGALATPSDDSRATREQLLERARVQQAQLVQLRGRVAELERSTAGARDRDRDHGPERAERDAGRPWYDPSPETLVEMAANCHVAFDEPSLDTFTPVTRPDDGRGIAAGDLADYNAAMLEVQKRWKDLVRSLYLETTGDAAGADALSSEAMRREIEDKSARGEQQALMRKLAQERAGLAPPPADPARTSTLERLLRAQVQLGNQSEAALAKRFGPERAHAIRGDGWGSRSSHSGCPDPR
jgi:hypothetical protein